MAVKFQFSGDELIRHYVKTFAASAGMKATSLALAFVLQLVLAREMGAEWYGEVTYALAWVGLLAIISVADSDGAAVRFVAELDSDGRRAAILGFLRWALPRIRCFMLSVFPVTVLTDEGRAGGKLVELWCNPITKADQLKHDYNITLLNHLSK